MKERIKTLIESLGLSTRAFALHCGLRQNTLSNQLNGMRELSLSTVCAVLNDCPDISAEWLMRGEGEMLKSASSDSGMERVMKLVDTIATLQDTINNQKETITALKERIKQLEK